MIVLLLLPCAGFAQSDFHTGQVAATGGAAAAHAHDNSALVSNPGALGLTPRYTIGILGGFWDGRDYRFGVSAVDGLTRPGVVLGIGYHRWRSTAALDVDELPGWIAAGDEPPTGRRYDQVVLGLAFPVLEQRLSFGLSGQVTHVSHAVLGNRWTGDLTGGIAARPTERWAVGVGARNLLPAFFETDVPPSVVGGTRYAWSDNTAVAVDVEVPFSVPEGSFPVALRAGAEIGDVTRELNVGWRLEGPTRQHWVSFGAGLWSDPETSADEESRAGLHYAAQVPLHSVGNVGKTLLAINHTLTIVIEPRAP